MTKQELVKSLIGRAMERVNKGISKKLTARRSSETPPMDPRHLTDTRTRVSTLLEYSLAYEMNILLEEEGAGFSISAVLWNVFPDLFLRDPSRTPVIGFEVKALHAAAEEKSANLATPLAVIKKGSDFVVVVIWAWQREDISGVSITYPHIHFVEVFDAYLLAQIRDYSWLFAQGDRIKGIDISTPIISSENKPKGEHLKAEEGNMGKLMRIDLDPALPKSVPNYEPMKTEADKYALFKQAVLSFGLTATFKEICNLQEATEITIADILKYPDTMQILGAARLPSGSRFILLAGGTLAPWMKKEPSDNQHLNGTTTLWLSQKLNWRVIRKDNNQWRVLGRGEKPDTALEQIRQALQ